MQRNWIFVGAILAALAVGVGALGAHWVDGYLESKHVGDLELAARRLENWKTGALYHMHHAIGMILVGLVSLVRQNKWLNIAGWSFLVGIIVFSGLLYVLVLTELRILGAIVPIGGVSFIVGWIALAIGGCCLPQSTPVSQIEIENN